ncbi:MAG: (2Fe-2S)-binding protein, partial [Acidimicrobiales bacterium]
MIVDLKVNGQVRRTEIGADEPLLFVLRERLNLRGAKDGCSEGECGACTVLVDGAPVDSCIYSAAAVGGREVRTVEGLAENGELNALQQAFVQAGAVQCGFCTPGFLMTLTALLEANPLPSETEISQALSGNICR